MGPKGHDQNSRKVLENGIKFMAAGEQGCVDQADRGFTVHGPSTDRSWRKWCISVTQQSPPQDDLVPPMDQKGGGWSSRQQHMAAPGQLLLQISLQGGLQLQTLFTAEGAWFRLGRISPGPQHSHQHQSNSRHPTEDFSALQFRGERFRQACIEQRQRQQHQSTDEYNTCGSGHQAILGWQNRYILLKCGSDA